jgi:hypothetical protein
MAVNYWGICFITLAPGVGLKKTFWCRFTPTFLYAIPLH